MHVVATKDFQYDGELSVRLGQVFELRGCRNDGGLIAHGLVQPLDPQPDEETLHGLPKCGECGRAFQYEWQRDRCGRMHEMTPDERMQERRAQAHRRVEERVIRVGT